MCKVAVLSWKDNMLSIDVNKLFWCRLLFNQSTHLALTIIRFVSFYLTAKTITTIQSEAIRMMNHFSDGMLYMYTWDTVIQSYLTYYNDQSMKKKQTNFRHIMKQFLWVDVSKCHCVPSSITITVAHPSTVVVFPLDRRVSIDRSLATGVLMQQCIQTKHAGISRPF